MPALDTTPTKRYTTTLLILTLWALPLVAGAAKATTLPPGLVETFSKLPAFHCNAQLSMKRYNTKIENQDLDTDSIVYYLRRLQNAQLAMRTAQERSRRSTPESHKRQQQIALLDGHIRKARALQGKFDRRLQMMQLCAFRVSLQRLAKRVSLSPQERKAVQDLLTIQSHFKPHEPLPLSQIKRRYLYVFQTIYRHFWRQKKLSANACAVLVPTYQTWASFYEADNKDNRTIAASSRKVPLYNSNGHNDSYRVWSWESQKGRIPKRGLTLLHLDSHPDMGGYKDRSPGHWSDRVLQLQHIHQALSHKSPTALRRFLYKTIKAAPTKAASPARKRAIARMLKQMTTKRLRASLRAQIYRRVHDIATPVTAASLAGIANKLLLCMPPWSHRFAMSEVDPKTKRSKGIPLRLIRERKTEINYFGVPTSLTKHPFVVNSEMPSFFPYNPKKTKYKPLPPKLPFYVTSCVNEDPGLIAGSPPKLPPFKSYFSKHREGKQGFILGFDLDVFSTNGEEYDNYVIPRSYGRELSLKTQQKPKARKARKHKHHAHAKRNRKDNGKALMATHQVNTKEYGLVKRRIKDLFARLAQAKKDGFIPRLITIADSTSLSRIYRDGLHKDGAGGGDYVPPCLAFLINYRVKVELAKLYKGKLYPTIEALVKRKGTSKKVLN